MVMNIKHILTILAFALSTIFSNAQDFAWAKSAGGSGYDYGTDVVIDPAGSTYTTGYFLGTADFDPGVGTFNLTSAGSYDVFILKLDASGNFVWAKQMGGLGYDYGHSITLDANGNILITGLFNGVADFDPGIGTFNMTSAGSTDIFVSKLDSVGNYVWARQMGGTAADAGSEICIDFLGNVYSAGTFNGTADFDPGTGTLNFTALSGSDIFVSKLDSSGNFIWAKQMGGWLNATNDGLAGLVTDSYGNVYTTGTFQVVGDFDPGPANYNLNSAGGTDIFISKLDQFGNFVWAKGVGGTGGDGSGHMAIDGLGNLYVTGSFVGVVDFDPGIGTYSLSASASDTYILKIDVFGNFMWAKQLGGSAIDQGYSITVDGNSNVYTSGIFQGTSDFDPGTNIFNLSSIGYLDVFISKLDASGNFVWAQAIGGVTNDYGNSICVDPAQNTIVVGSYQGAADFDPTTNVYNLTSAGNDDIFILKMSQCVSSSIDSHTQCNSFTWIDGNTYYSSNNTATYTIPGGAVSGCDSMITLDLTILNSSYTADYHSECNSFTWIDGITYFSNNSTATYTLPGGAANGCDSIINLILTIDSVSDITTTTSALTISANNAGATYQWLDCGNGYSSILGATNQSFSPPSNGSYAVELTENGCRDTSACQNFISVGMGDNSNNETVTISPNPTSGSFLISRPEPLANCTLLISDVTGQEIFCSNYDITANLIEINLSAAAGVYFVELIEGNRKSNFRLIKQ
jgi:hypothetical protein